jgi:hypothetical protein
MTGKREEKTQNNTILTSVSSSFLEFLLVYLNVNMRVILFFTKFLYLPTTRLVIR